MSAPEVFALPATWRSPDPDAAAAREERADFADLAGPLGRLAEELAVDPVAVTTAVHLKVLSMLTEERVIGLEIVRPCAAEAVRVLWASLDAAPTWRDVVGEADRAQLAASAPTPDPGQQPLGSVRPWGRVVLVARPLDAALRPEPPHDVPDSDHDLRVSVSGGAIVLSTPDGSSLSADALPRLAAMYRRVLEAVSADPGGDARVACLPAAERHAVLSEWAGGAAADRGADTVVELFVAQAAKTPDALAVRTPEGGLSFRELDAWSNQIADLLRERGVGSHAPVGVCLRRSPELLPVLLGVWKAGAPYLPLDADLPALRIGRMLAAAACVLVVTATEHLPALAGFDPEGLILLDAQRETVARRPATPVSVPLGPTHPAYIMFTSGSTGTPKGVLVHHGGLVNYLLWALDEYIADATGGSPFLTSIAFDLGVPSLFAPLLAGQTVDLLPDPLDPADLGVLLAAGSPYSFVKITPGHLNLLSLDLLPDQARRLAGVVIAAGDAFPGTLAQRWIELAGPGGTAVATEYGPTEITVGNSGRRIQSPDTAQLVPLGTPLPNTTMFVLTDHLEPVPVGVSGEVYIGGAGVSCGYVGQAGLTASRFVPDPWGPAGTRLYRTGDRGRWLASGEVEFLGRTDHQVKIRGHRVEVDEIAEVLRRRPDVREAVVVAVGSGNTARLAAFVVPAAGHALAETDLRTALAGELPAYMIPAEIVLTGEIPLTANGKVDTRRLRDGQRPDAGAPGQAREPVSGPVAEPEYRVVVNHEEQYSIWEADRVAPDGWRAEGFRGARGACLAHIDAIWTDLRPRSARAAQPVTVDDHAGHARAPHNP